jgi:hypothetical protein
MVVGRAAANASGFVSHSGSCVVQADPGPTLSLPLALYSHT